MDFEDYLESIDSFSFLAIVWLGVLQALLLRHYTGRWYDRLRWQIGFIPSHSGKAGAAVATQLLSASGLNHVSVEAEGERNCYDPQGQRIRLSDDTFGLATLAALASGAHEVGHAQHFAEKILRCRLRKWLWPACRLAPCVVGGYGLLCVGGLLPWSASVLYSAVVATTVFCLLAPTPITLPLESDANRRARKLVRECGLVAAAEQQAFDRLLDAGWKTHLSSEIQRWIVALSIVCACTGMMWYETGPSRLDETWLVKTATESVTRPAQVAPTAPSAFAFENRRGPTQAVGQHANHGWRSAMIIGGLTSAVPLIVLVICGVFLVKTRPRLWAGKQLHAEDKAAIHMDKGNSLLESGSPREALAEFTRALQLNEQLTLAWHQRGQAHLSLGDMEQALADFHAAAQLAPHFLEGVASRAYARLHPGFPPADDNGIESYSTEQAFADTESVLSADPTNLTALTARLNHWSRAGRNDLAIADFTAAIQVDPQCGDFFRERGLLYYFEGQWVESISDATQAIHLTPSDGIAWNNRGAAHLQRGDWKKAMEDLCQAIEVKPDLPNAYRHLAWLQAACPDSQFRNGERAVVNATHALELTEWKKTEWLEVLAAAYAEAGQFDEAQRWQRKQIEVAPQETRADQRARLALYQNRKPHRVPTTQDSTIAAHCGSR